VCVPLLPIRTAATVQLLYAIRILTVTISVHTVTNMYGSHTTVTVCDSNPDCHYISAHCYQYVRQPHYSYCMRFESSLSLYQCTLLPICTAATVQLLYAIRILTVTISVHTVTNMYGSHSCYSHLPLLPYRSVLCLNPHPQPPFN
jgi:hypothetical protein